MIPAKRSGRHVGDRAHQQAARAAALRDDPAGARIALGDEMPRGGEEVAEGVRLLQELAVLVPAPALVGSAAHVGDGVDEAAVDQREAIAREARLDRIAIGAVAGEQKRRGAVELGVAPHQERHRHALAVFGAGEDEPGEIALGIEAGDLLLLDERPRAGGAIVVEDLLRPVHRRIAEAEEPRIEFVDRLEAEGVGLLVERDVVRLAAPKIVDRQARAAVLARQHDEIIPEQRRIGDEAAVAMRDDVAPVRFLRRLARSARRS